MQREENDYFQIYENSIKTPDSFWAEQAEEFISWHKKWDKISNWDYQTAEIKWFEGAELNVCYNCVDRHLSEKATQPAIIWEGNEPGDVKKITYQELYDNVCRFANKLKSLGIRKGDRVVIYLPMIPELIYSMLACARIGAIHSVIFAGFSANAIKDRVLDSSCKLVITADFALRGTKTIPLKETVKQALKEISSVEILLIKKKEKNDWEHESPVCDYEIMSAEDPLFILYTSGSTGKPKGVLHTSGGYLLYAAVTHKHVFNYQDGDIYFCAADIGWITGHSYIVYGPLANGATTLMFESIPTYPDAGRYWDVIERHKVNIFYTAPTAIRAVAKAGFNEPDKYDLSSLKVLGSVGEPINQEAWIWYHDKVGKGKCIVVDTWWQTETGGIMITPLPEAVKTGLTKTKPGSATLPFFGIEPIILDEKDQEITEPNTKGRLFLKSSWPGQMRTVYGDHERFKTTYFSQKPGLYFTGDAAYQDKDGYYWITGRVDDVINVSGHRIGTAEIESAVINSNIVAEAAVIAVEHEIKGSAVIVFAILKTTTRDSEIDKKRVITAVREEIGAFATPDKVYFVPGLPKTRSGKIMRRILRKIAEGNTDNLGDITTLAEPGVVEDIITICKST